MGTLTRQQILDRKIGQETVTLSDGAQVRVRGLNRAESIKVASMGDDVNARDDMIIHQGMVDPKLSLEDVAAWAENDAAGDISTVSEAIARLSGMLETSGKEAYKSTRRRQ